VLESHRYLLMQDAGSLVSACLYESSGEIRRFGH